MKLATFLDPSGRSQIGAVHGDHVVVLTRALPPACDMVSVAAQWSEIRAAVEREAAAGSEPLPLEQVRLLAPVSRPGKIMAIGLNYADHIAESRMPKPQQQFWFSKAVTSINGPHDSIELPIASSKLDYEAELVVVIGKRGRHIPAHRAAEHVFGYCAGNDVSVRDWQKHTSQFVVGKSFDTHAPIGPWIVTSDELNDPHTLGIRCLVNGEVRQSSNTSKLVFNVFEQIAYLSEAMTLEPGDLLFTGTPGGVGAAMKPPSFLRAGDRVRVEIDRIGAIEGEVRPEAPAHERA
jgi:ureidoglycolate lyase